MNSTAILEFASTAMDRTHSIETTALLTALLDSDTPADSISSQGSISDDTDSASWSGTTVQVTIFVAAFVFMTIAIILFVRISALRFEGRSLLPTYASRIMSNTSVVSGGSGSVEPPLIKERPASNVTEEEILEKYSLTVDRLKKMLGTTVEKKDKVSRLSLPTYLKMERGVDFTIEEAIQEGNTISLFRGLASNEDLIERAGADKVVVKQLRVGSPAEDLTRFLTQVRLLNKLRFSPHVCNLCGYCDDPVSMILRDHGTESLNTYLETRPPSKKRVLRFLIHISTGMQHIAAMNVVHCDIKPDNIIVEWKNRKKPKCVISNFEDGVEVDKNDATAVRFRASSIAYTAPEVVYNPQLQPKFSRDTYSFAIVVFRIATGRDWQ